MHGLVELGAKLDERYCLREEGGEEGRGGEEGGRGRGDGRVETTAEREVGDVSGREREWTSRRHLGLYAYGKVADVF